MRTGRSLTVCLSLLLGVGGCLLLGGLLLGGCLLGESPSGVPPSGRVSFGGVSLAEGSPWGASFLGGPPSWGGLLLGGVSLLGGASFWRSPYWEGCLLGGVPPSGGCLLLGGSPWQTPPPPLWTESHSCKNITLATTSLRPVKIKQAILGNIWSSRWTLLNIPM